MDNQKSSRFLAALLCLGFLLLPSVQIQAQAENQQPNQKNPDMASAPVLDSQEVDLGQRSIFYNRIAPPELKPEPVFQEVGSKPSDPTPTAEELEEARRCESLQQVTLSLSCTAIEGTGLTELRWREGDKEIVAWSTLNFSHLTQVLSFSTEASVYNLMFTVQETTSAEDEASNAEIQRRSLPSSLLISMPQLEEEVTGGIRKSAFRFVSPNQMTEEIRQTMADLHLYVDAHREQLASQYQEREAARLAQEKELRENPPKPVDTIIQYFPIYSHPIPSSGGIRRRENP